MARILPDLMPLRVPITRVYNDPNNVNVHPPDQIRKLRDTLRTYGQHKPLVVQEKDGKFLCRIGNGTLEAARLEGWTEIAVVRADEDDIVASARAIRDNTAPWGSEFDSENLRSQLQQISDETPELLSSLGWDSNELSELMDSPVDYLSKALDEADETNDSLVYSSKEDGGEDDLPEALESDWSPDPDDKIIIFAEEDHSVSATEAAQWLTNHAALSDEVVRVISDLFHPIQFYRVVDPTSGAFVKFSCKVTDE